MSKKEKKSPVLPKLPRGMGSLTRRKDGFIMYRKEIGEENNKLRKYVYGETVQEAMEKMHIAEQEYLLEQKEIKTINTSALLGLSMERWLIDNKQDLIKNSSYDREEATLYNQILKYPIAKMQVQAVKSNDIQKHIKLLINKQYSYSTIKKVYDLFQQYFRNVYISNSVYNPMELVMLPKKELLLKDEKEMIAFDKEQIRKIVEVATSKYNNGNYIYKHGIAIVFTLFIFTRVGEGLALCWSDIDFEKKTVNITKTVSRCINRDNNSEKKYILEINTPKTKNGMREVYMSDDAFELAVKLKEYKNPKSEDEYIFSTTNNNLVLYRNVYRTFQSILKKAGIDMQLGLHSLRHTGISHNVNSGVAVPTISKMAGHASTKMTLDRYFHVTDANKQEINEKVNRNRIL